MNHPTILIKTVAAANAQISTTRINTNTVMLRARSSNTGNVRIAFAVFDQFGSAGAGSFTAPADPLTDSIALVLGKGEAITFGGDAWRTERGEYYDLQRIYFQGTASDVLEVVYEERFDK